MIRRSRRKSVMAAFIRSKITTYVLTGLLALIGLVWIDSYVPSRYYDTASGMDTFMNIKGSIDWKHRLTRDSAFDPFTGSLHVWSFWGVQFLRVSKGDGGFWELTISHWLFALLVAVISVPGWLHLGRKRLRSKRRKRGLCPTCGFDLRASGSRCPECGSEVSTTPQTSEL